MYIFFKRLHLYLNSNYFIKHPNRYLLFIKDFPNIEERLHAFMLEHNLVKYIRKILNKRIDSKIDWYNVSRRKDLSVNFLREFKNYLSWNSISGAKYDSITTEFMEEFKDFLSWRIITPKLNIGQVRLFAEYVDWHYISKHFDLSERLISEFKGHIDWVNISVYQKLPLSFISKYQYELDWNAISRHQQLSENFIREFLHKINWSNISTYQKLSEDFIIEFQDKLEWSNISEFQTLSEDFIIEFSERVDWKYILNSQNISDEFILKHFIPRLKKK